MRVVFDIEQRRDFRRCDDFVDEIQTFAQGCKLSFSRPTVNVRIVY